MKTSMNKSHQIQNQVAQERNIGIVKLFITLNMKNGMNCTMNCIVAACWFRWTEKRWHISL